MKYPRTYHLPWSEGRTSDDKVLSDISQFEGREIVVTEKMDGENTTITPSAVYARSVDSKYHPTRTWVKTFAASFQYMIPNKYRVCGENLYAKHSIGYEDLPSYFLGFSVWNGETCLSWDDTVEWFARFGITPVKVLYRGVFDEAYLRDLAGSLDLDTQEGYVVRAVDSFCYDDFSTLVGKFVRAGHVQTDDQHWLYSGKSIETNGLQRQK